MPDPGTQIRDYYDEIVIRVGADEILQPSRPITPLVTRRFPGVLVAGLAAAVVLLIIGSLGLWLASAPTEIEPVGPPTTQQPDPAVLPEESLESSQGQEPSPIPEGFLTPELEPSPIEEPPEQKPLAIAGEPLVFTFSETLDGQTTVAKVTWHDDSTWRLDVVSGSLGSAGAGSFHIYADQTMFSYTVDTNEYLEEHFAAIEGRRNLVGTGCDNTGSCGPEGLAVVCLPTAPDSSIAGRPVTRYDCEAELGGAPVMWIDDDNGYMLRWVDGSDTFEVVEIDLDPVIDPSLFDQVCPTSDCTLVDSN